MVIQTKAASGFPASTNPHDLLAAMIEGVLAIDVDALEPMIRVLKGYTERELLDCNSDDLMLLLKMLHHMTSFSGPTPHIQSIRADAQETLARVANDLG